MMCDDPADRIQVTAGREKTVDHPISGQMATERVASFFAAYGSQVHLPSNRTLPAGWNKDIKFALVRSGVLLVSIDLPDDRRQVLCLHFPKDLLIATALEVHQGAKLSAATDVTMVGLDARSLEIARLEAPETLEFLLAEAAGSIERLLLHSASIGRLRSDERLATFFLEWAAHLGRRAGKAILFDCSVRRDDIADYLSINKDTLSRSMAKLRRDHVILPFGSGYMVPDWQELARRTPLAAAITARKPLI